jgi:hypothetical protein
MKPDHAGFTYDEATHQWLPLDPAPAPQPKPDDEPEPITREE